MIVICPNCATHFNFIKGDKADSEVRLRCSVCKHIFILPRDKFEFAEEVHVDGRSGVEGKGTTGGGMDIGEHGRNVAKVLLLVSLALAIGLGAWLYYVQPAGIDIRGIRDNMMHRPVKENVKGIALEDVRQYWVQNDRVGRLVVIEGRVRNTGDEPKRGVAVDVALYDAANVQVGFSRQMVGNLLTLFQLQTLSEVELNDALHENEGIPSSDVCIVPGGNVRFMAVVPNPQPSTVEFGVRIAMVKAH